MRDLITIAESLNEYPKPHRVSYPYGRPGDGFRRHAETGKATCVVEYRNIDPRLLKDVPRGNSLRYELDDLVADMKENGYRGGPGQNILVYVSNAGAKIGEGNHRLAAAILAGVPGVDVQVRYLNGADETNLIWPIDLENPSLQVIED